MALVAYDNSDASDYEEENENATMVTLLPKTEDSTSTNIPPSIQVAETNDSNAEDGTTLFNLLPKPASKKSAVVEEDDEFLHKKEETNIAKPKAKISVPSLNDFKDVESTIPAVKPKPANGKKSGLLSILPQPRNSVTATTKSMIPHVLTQKPNLSVKTNPAKLPTPLTKTKIDPKPLINDYSDDSDNEEVVNDFFSINKPVTVPDYVDVPLDIPADSVQADSHTTINKPRGIESFFKKDEPTNHVHLEPDVEESMPEQGEASSSHVYANCNDVALDEEAIMKLCGSRGKRKREEIQIVDVNQQEVLADSREWLLKGLMDDTSKRVSASKKKGNEFTNQQRRKHQITYLAYQAKANEAELQNQWANNRMSKRQTQAKYGF